MTGDTTRAGAIREGSSPSAGVEASRSGASSPTNGGDHDMGLFNLFRSEMAPTGKTRKQHVREREQKREKRRQAAAEVSTDAGGRGRRQQQPGLDLAHGLGSPELSLGAKSDDGRGGGRLQFDDSREGHFDVEAGRFRDPSTGVFEAGSPPPDYAPEANRFRAEDGKFKARSSDLYDEPEEVRRNSLAPRG